MIQRLTVGKDDANRPQVVDARPPNLFHGNAYRWSISDRKLRIRNIILGADAGHMPGALHLPHGSLIDQTNQRLKSNDQLAERKLKIVEKRTFSVVFFLSVFKNAGVDLSKPSIYTCHSGITASTLAFVAHMLGQKDFSLYVV